MQNHSKISHSFVKQTALPILQMMRITPRVRNILSAFNRSQCSSLQMTSPITNDSGTARCSRKPLPRPALIAGASVQHRGAAGPATLYLLLLQLHTEAVPLGTIDGFQTS